MENQRDREFVLPKNIRQMGKMGETYKIYVEDFVYTYVHRTLREEQKTGFCGGSAPGQTFFKSRTGIHIYQRCATSRIFIELCH